ncbi:unnamed protein product [Clonostachys rosea f. rosea IK726]|uniref:Uncharacterized protein n=1 Tax=Clonostachys rosea f. rosea IK726 TaxID=1349383 RepID=A0ACA9THZ2_BIOOC|nr:unnamed protein product [Clonostachys rosea f. rosea IK726]
MKMNPIVADTLANPRFQLFATAVFSGATVASLILGYQSLERGQRISRLKNSIPRSEADDGKVTYSDPPVDKEDARNQALARRAQAGDFDEELILEQLARNRVFLKPEGLDKLRDSFVVVVGCGGVGSHATASLARSGASKIRLVDFDQVTLSSLNRHAVATLADVGTPKVRCLERRLIAIAPWVQFDLRQEKFDDDVAEKLLGPWGETDRKPDFVIDAIDNIDTKVALLKYCHDNKLPVISSMGAGCKSDPTRIIVGDISTSTDDALSRSTRRRLKLVGVHTGIPVVYSMEKTGDGKAELLPLPEEEFQKGSVGDLGPMANFRVRILPVLGTMPAVFGLTVANHVILALTGYPYDYAPGKGRDKLYDGVFNYVQGVEEKLHRLFHPNLTGLKIPLTTNDVAFLLDELYQGKSVITGISTKIVLIRWRKPSEDNLIVIGEEPQVQRSSRLKLSDLVCMTKEEAARHEKRIFKKGKKLEDLYDAETIARVDAKRLKADRYEAYRASL